MAFQESRAAQTDELGAEGNSATTLVDGLTRAMHAGEEIGLVRLYAGQLEAQVRDLEALLRSADPNMRGIRARLRN